MSGFDTLPGVVLINRHIAELRAGNALDEAEVLEAFLAEYHKIRFERTFHLMRAKEEEHASEDRLTLRFGADWG